MDDISIDWGVRIPMRDGVSLGARIYRPAKPLTRKPSILTITPYTADRYHLQAKYFAGGGRPFVIVDSRGRGDSDGVFRPYAQEAADGADCVQWLASQPFCDGQVGMWGGSYGGHAQWAAARAGAKALRTLCPTAAPWLGIDFPMRNNIAYPYILQWIAMTHGRATQNQMFGDTSFWSHQFFRWLESGRPFCELDSAVGLPSDLFQEWMAHPELDSYWEAQNPGEQDYARIDCPVLTTTGSYDDDQAGALEHYRRHTQASATGAQDHYLVIGPWNHYRAGTPAREFSGITVGPESLVDLLKLHEDWYAFTMEGAPRPAFLRKRVAYYVMGSEEWRYADTLDAVTARRMSYHLDSAGAGSGRLQDLPGRGMADQYCYDPTAMGGPEAIAELQADPESVTDDTLLSALGNRLISYETTPFEQAVEVAGFFRLRAWISIDAPDTDIYVTVHEVLPDGTTLRLSGDAIRARYRQNLRRSVLISSKKPLLYDFQRFTFVARTLSAGSRLRLVIAPVGRMIDASFWQRNFNAGGLISQEACEVGRAVTVKLFHDDAHQSVLEVPVGI